MYTNKNNKIRVLVTGASGFLGKNLALYLSKEIFTFIPVSYREDFNISLFHNTDVIIHLGGKAHDVINAAKDEEYVKANYLLTQKLFDQFVNSDVKTFIFLSSVKAVTDRADEPLTEEAIANPTSIYGRSKNLAEEYILKQTLANSKRFFVLRPCMIHGAGNKGNLNLLYNFVSKGLPWPLGAFENERTLCSIDNICFVIKELIENETILSGIYNIADDDPISTNQLIQLISESQGKKTFIFKIPKPLIKFLAKSGDLFGLPLNSERLNKLTENFMVSNKKIKLALNKQLPVTTKDGLTKTFNSFKNA